MYICRHVLCVHIHMHASGCRIHIYICMHVHLCLSVYMFYTSRYMCMHVCM